VLLPGLVDTLLGHRALRFLLRLRVEFLDQSIEMTALLGVVTFLKRSFNRRYGLLLRKGPQLEKG